MPLYFVSGHQMRPHCKSRPNQHVEPRIQRRQLWVGNEYHAYDHKIGTPQLVYPATPQWLQSSLQLAPLRRGTADRATHNEKPVGMECRSMCALQRPATHKQSETRRQIRRLLSKVGGERWRVGRDGKLTPQ